MQRNNNSIMIFEIIRGGEKLTGWGKNGPAYFFPGERMGLPILSPGKKLTGRKFRPVTPVCKVEILQVTVNTIEVLSSF